MNQSPDNPAVLNNAGLGFAVDRNFPRAIEALQHAARVSKSPLQRKQVELNLALIYGVSGDFDTAREVAGKHLEGPALENNLGLYAHLAKDDALAKSYLNMALTQSTTYYERAWENLDALNNSGHSDSTDAKPTPEPKPVTRAALPKTDALAAPKPAPVAKPSKSKRDKKAHGSAHTLTKPSAPVEVEPAIEQPITQAPAATPSESPAPAVASDKPANTDKPAASGKPAGLVVGPSEGN